MTNSKLNSEDEGRAEMLNIDTTMCVRKSSIPNSILYNNGFMWGHAVQYLNNQGGETKKKKKPTTQHQNSKPAPFKADGRHRHTVALFFSAPQSFYIFTTQKTKNTITSWEQASTSTSSSGQGNPGSYFTDSQHCTLLMPLQLLCNWNYLKHWNEKGWEKKHTQ